MIAVVKNIRPTFAFVVVTSEAGVKQDAFMHADDFDGDFSTLAIGSTVELEGVQDTPKGLRVLPGVKSLSPEDATI